MTVKKTLLLALATLLAFFAGAQDLPQTNCLVKTSSSWGAPCEKCEYYKDGFKRDFSGTYSVALKNTCSDLVEVKVAVQEKGGTWRIFPVKTLTANEVLTVFACQGTGKYIYWARRVNDTEIILPSDHEILTEYRSR